MLFALSGVTGYQLARPQLCKPGRCLIPSVVGLLGGRTLTAIPSLGLTEPHRGLFFCTTVAKRIRSQLLDHHLEFTWKDNVKERLTVCWDLKKQTNPNFKWLRSLLNDSSLE